MSNFSIVRDNMKKYIKALITSLIFVFLTWVYVVIMGTVIPILPDFISGLIESFPTAFLVITCTLIAVIVLLKVKPLDTIPKIAVFCVLSVLLNIAIYEFNNFVLWMIDPFAAEVIVFCNVISTVLTSAILLIAYLFKKIKATEKQNIITE